MFGTCDAVTDRNNRIKITIPKRRLEIKTVLELQQKFPFNYLILMKTASAMLLITIRRKAGLINTKNRKLTRVIKIILNRNFFLLVHHHNMKSIRFGVLVAALQMYDIQKCYQCTAKLLKNYTSSPMP